MLTAEDIIIGKRYRFAYPIEFRELPEYSAHRGQTVTVLRPLTLDEHPNQNDGESTPMFKIEAADGWTGDAWEDELAELEGDA